MLCEPGKSVKEMFGKFAAESRRIAGSMNTRLLESVLWVQIISNNASNSAFSSDDEEYSADLSPNSRRMR